MKGNPMKEKVAIILPLICFIGIMWFSSTNKTANLNPAVSEKSVPLPIDNYPQEYIDDIIPETTYVNDIPQKLDISDAEACVLKPIETNVITFGEAFQHYRQCMGPESSFKWKGSIYTTRLAEEVIIQITDSVEVKEEVKNNNEVSEIR